MARAIWSGAVSFGLVNVPIKLYSATQQKDVRFHQFEEGTNERIRYKRVAEESGEEVPFERIVKGYELDQGRYVMVTPEELEAVEPGQTRTIEIEDFIDLDEIDPVFFEKSYYLGPAGGQGSEKPYALLRDAMAETNKVGIARFVMRTKQYLATIRSSGSLLVLETMFFPDEVREPTEVDNVPGEVELSEREQGIATQLIESLTTTWEPERYRDTYRERVLELIDRKAEGAEVVAERPKPEGGKVVDLMAALEASVKEARQGRSGEPGERASADGSSSGGEGRYEAMTKDELYDEAQRRHIAGRSSMTKDELAAALRQAS